MSHASQKRPRKGRGAIGNPSGRFEPLIREAVDDDWGVGRGAGGDGSGDGGDADVVPPATVVTDEACRTIIARNDSPDVPFDRSINPYRGCEHGCVYCFARPTHAYLGLSPGLDFETHLVAKTNAPAVLERQLRAPGYRPQPITLGANTDPYQPIERERCITRGILEVLSDCHHPVAVVTKSRLVTRDVDLLAPMAARRLGSVAISVTTLDPRLAGRMEPRASAPRRRLEAIRTLTDAGIRVSVLVAPLIPFINDHEIEAILAAAARAGAVSAGAVLLRLPHEVKDLFADWLQAHAPLKAARVLARVRECRGGALYDAAYGTRMTGEGAYAELLQQRLRLACGRLGLGYGRAADFDLDTSQFRRPDNREGSQLSLL
ncbi:MAG: PA0069 family radical SAM protein [Rhodospirillales bacterium]|nr:PA0069 family radical SAM protein [Rhodospirillales bacterium]